MGQQLFVPLTDDLMYDTPEKITSGLMPYSVDAPCYHWQVELEEDAESGQHAASIRPNVIPFPPN